VPQSALLAVVRYPSLSRAWNFLYHHTRASSRNTRGIDGISVNEVALDPKPELRRLAWELANGIFSFSPLRPHLIPKLNGKDRLICVPTIRDRIVQRALLDFLTSRYLTRFSNPISYGFVRYRTVQLAAKLACKHRSSLPWVFKTDIASFFDMVDRSLLANAIKRIIREKSIRPLLIAATLCEIDPPSRSTAKRITALGIKQGRGVRQGMPLSPFFANLILEQFDRSIIKTGYKAIRYADDLIFFASTEQECYKIHAFCRSELAKLKLSIPDVGPESKSRIYEPNEPAEFLGLGLSLQEGSYTLRLMPKQMEKIRSELLHLSSISELLSRKITLASLAAQIQNRTSGYLNAYEVCTNIQEAENELAGLTQKILLKIYRDGLKINLETLSTEARTFLGVT